MLFTRHKTPQLSPTGAAARAASGALVLVDPKPDERLEVRPPGSLHIPLADIPARLGELPGDRTVAFICRSGPPAPPPPPAAAGRGLSVTEERR